MQPSSSQTRRARQGHDVTATASCTSRLFLPLKRFLRISLRHALLAAGRAELYKDIKGRRVVIHSEFQQNLLTGDCGQSHPRGEPSEGCL